MRVPDFQLLQKSKLRKNTTQVNNLRYFNIHREPCMHRITSILAIFLFFFLMDINAYSQEKTSITKVVIDAGHGGKDPGTIGKKSQEKNIALQIALKLSEDIRDQCKGVTVICTRTTDEFIELHERAEIANRSKADLFISIHCNANPKHIFQGAETYVMGLHRTEANLEIAKKENAAILMEPDYSTNYNGFDPNSDESYITFTLFQNAFLEQSSRFASFVQDEMKDRVGMNDRGVRQAGFLVLYKTTMPSVLIETGFLSNPEEEKFLMSEKGQQYIASAICRAFCKFKAKMEGTPIVGATLAVAHVGKTHPGDTNPVAHVGKTHPGDTTPVAHPGDTTVVTHPGDTPAVAHVTPIGSHSTKTTDIHKPKTTVAHKPKTTSNNHRDTTTIALAHKTAVAHPRPTTVAYHVKIDTTVGATLAVAHPGSTSAVPHVGSNEIVFRVQIATSPKELSNHSKKFEGLPDVWHYVHQGLFKYTAGKEPNPSALSTLMAQVKKMGFTDAFIVAFHGTERITIAEAKKLISEIEK